MGVSRETKRQIRLGLKDSWLVCLGLVPLGLAFGLLVTQAGFAWWWAPIFSVIIYSGSMEFLAIGMVTSGFGVFSSALTAFMVNFRHIFYGLTFPRDIARPGLPRLYLTYGVTDELYALTSTLVANGARLTHARLMTSAMLINASWILPGIIGALVGNLIPEDIEGFEFALTALFAVLAYEAFQSSKDLSAPLIAGALAVVAAFMFPDQMIIIGLLAYFGVLLLRFWAPRIDDLLTWQVK